MMNVREAVRPIVDRRDEKIRKSINIDLNAAASIHVAGHNFNTMDVFNNNPATSMLIQPKLIINQPDDKYEQEADKMADQVMRTPDSVASRNARFRPVISTNQRGYTAYEKEEVQRKESEASTTPAISPAVEQTLLSPGQPMDQSMRSFMERRFGYDFGNVKIHDDVLAHRSSGEINALAYTNRNHVVFGEGNYRPQTKEGQKLLAHELTHVVQQGRRHGAERIQRKTLPAHRVKPSGDITRAVFDNHVMKYFGVATVKTGTQTEQEQSLTRTGSPAPSISNWQTWDPGASSDLYSDIINAIEDVGAKFNAIPTVSEIHFYKYYYDLKNGGPTPNKNVGASFGAGVLTIYEAFSRDRSFPSVRSDSSGKYKLPVLVLGPAQGETPGAPRPWQSQTKSVKENIAHEIGHGIGEAAAAANPATFVNFSKEIGWVANKLYDIGQPTVAQAIAAGTAPPAQHEIQENDWNNAKWVEQPMSRYSVLGGPGEDFAETVTAFVYAEAILKDRSPKRHKFMIVNMMSWISKMNLLPAPASLGDFIITDEVRHTA